VRSGGTPAVIDVPAEAVVYDFISELTNTKGVAQATYDSVLRELSEQGLIDLLGILGYFTSMCMVLRALRVLPKRPPTIV
jgi:4-carboxymuconolactone decarboxylase